LLIHLIRRTEQTAIDFPALRWLRESVRPRRRLRFDDIPLLLVRLALLALLAALLSMPVLIGDWREPRHWVVVAEGVDVDAARQRLPQIEGEWRWLAPGFPPVDSAPPAATAHFSSLLREFDATRGKSDRLSVLVPEVLRGLDAERLQLAHEVDWQIVPARTPAAPAPSTGPTRVALRVGQSPVAGEQYLRAVVAAWETSEPGRWQVVEETADRSLAGSTDWLIGLGPDVSPETLSWIRDGGHGLILETDPGKGSIVWRNAQGSPLASDEVLGKGHLVRLLKPLEPGVFPELLEARFAERIRAMLSGPAVAPATAWAGAVRPEQDKELASRVTTPLQPWLALVVALVFLLERVLATRRRAAP
jgi:hypothetical protein